MKTVTHAGRSCALDNSLGPLGAIGSFAGAATLLLGHWALLQYFLPRVHTRSHVGSPYLPRPRMTEATHRWMVGTIQAEQRMMKPVPFSASMDGNSTTFAASQVSRSRRAQQQATGEHCEPQLASRVESQANWPVLTKGIELVRVSYQAIDAALYDVMVAPFAAQAADVKSAGKEVWTCDAEGRCVEEPAATQPVPTAVARMYATPAALKKRLTREWEVEYSASLKKHPGRSLEGVLIVVVDINHESRPMEQRIAKLMSELLGPGDLFLAEATPDQVSGGICDTKLNLDPKVRRVGIDAPGVREQDERQGREARLASAVHQPAVKPVYMLP